MANPWQEVVNWQRDKERPSGLIDNARNGADVAANLQAASATTQDNNGYYNGGTYVSFFVLGKSLLNGPDALA